MIQPIAKSGLFHITSVVMQPKSHPLLTSCITAAKSSHFPCQKAGKWDNGGMDVDEERGDFWETGSKAVPE